MTVSWIPSRKSPCLTGIFHLIVLVQLPRQMPSPYRTGTLTTVAVYNPDLNTTKSLAKHLLSTPISTTSSRKNCWRNDTKVVQGSGTGMISAPGHGFFSPEEKVYSHQYELQGVHICMPFSALQPRGKFSRRMFMACEARYRHKIKVAL